MKFSDRIQHAWNAFKGRDPTRSYINYGPGYASRPDRVRFTRGNERTIISAIYNRIAVDVASIGIEHVRLDNQDRYLGQIDSGLNNCLTLEANIDQTGRAFLQDIVQSMLDEGCIAVCPIDTDTSILGKENTYEILTMRVGKIVQWYPKDVRVRVYNDEVGHSEEVVFPKKRVAIIENPFYAVMNEPNSTLQRIIHKLTLMDMVDEQSGSGKLDLIIQLPYVVKGETKKSQAAQRRKDIEMQLTNSKYGIAYIDGTEHVTQLNRSVDNQFLTQIEYFVNLLYSQLGITASILDGSADDQTLNNYYTRTIEPIISAIVDEFKRKFLTKTARTRKQSIAFFMDPFKLIPITKIAEIGDSLTRNEIVSSNEMRQYIGLKPSQDPAADELRNKNLNPVDGSAPAMATNQNGIESDPYQDLDDIDTQINELESMLGE